VSIAPRYGVPEKMYGFHSGNLLAVNTSFVNFLFGKNCRMLSNPIGLFGGPLGYSGIGIYFQGL
jgi:hypothetical protein